MQLKQRIKKLETVIGTADDEFCQCFYKHEMALINKVYGSPYVESDILPDETLITDLCERCKKPVPESTRKYYHDLELIYGEGATKES